MTDPGGRWSLDVRPRAQRQLAPLPEKVATATAEFIVGPLLDNPRRVGNPLRDEYAGQHSARRGQDWREVTGCLEGRIGRGFYLGAPRSGRWRAG